MTEPGSLELNETSVESAEQEQAPPTPEEYSELLKPVKKFEDIKRDKRRYDNMPDQTKQEYEKEYEDALKKVDEAKERILEQTDAVPFEDGFVELAKDSNKNGDPIVRVAKVWGDLSVDQGFTTDPKLGTAPKQFREAMYNGPYVVNSDGSLDISQPYRKVPDSEASSPGEPVSSETSQADQTQDLPKAA